MKSNKAESWKQCQYKKFVLMSYNCLNFHIVLLFIPVFRIRFILIRIRPINKIYFTYIFSSSKVVYVKFWFSTISFYICQNIHFTDILIKYKIFYIKKWEFSYNVKGSKIVFFLYKFLFSTNFILYLPKYKFYKYIYKYKIL